ncbi:mRNA capping enzyme, catalytic domain-containing protein [Fusarium oxysporum]|nr:mRNA capping enzyme, catalytic domain-containing protein [Fusarium oxysporum]
MWNDEDNNPYGTSFDRRDSQSSSVNPTSPSTRNYQSFEPPQTPTSGSDDEHGQFGHGGGNDDGDSAQDTGPKRKPGGYDSRIEQILYENPKLSILITDAGKSLESGGRYIVYTIKTGDLEVRRRYQTHVGSLFNRCRRMDEIRTDGVGGRFLDPNAAGEVLHSHPVSSIPKSILKAPPLDPANPTPAHSYLPIPAASAKLKTVAGTNHDNSSGHIQAGPHAFGRFPPEGHNLGEQELDPYFISYESSIKELEQLLTGPMEKVNRRTLSHLSSLAADLCELGSVYNAFAVSEQAPSLGPAIERIGQAADLSYIATEELSGSLGASFAEPMREHAQFAGVVRSVLKYRVLKRVQQDLTSEELNKKRALLDQLEQSEAEARRIENYLSSTLRSRPLINGRDGGQDDTESIDSDFPGTHGEFSSHTPSASQGLPERGTSAPSHKKMPKTRRDLIGKTRESIGQLEQAQVVSERDVKEASTSVLKDMKRFQKDKEDDLRRYMLAYAQSQIEWAKKNLLTMNYWSRQEGQKSDTEDRRSCLPKTWEHSMRFSSLSQQQSNLTQRILTTVIAMAQQDGPIASIAEPGIKAQGQLLHEMRKEVANLLNRSATGFPGAQPVSFARQHLEELAQHDYYVVEKSDGIRYLLYSTTDENGNEAHYLIDRKKRLLNSPEAFHTNTLIDGELVWDTGSDGKRVPMFLVFDCLVLDGALLMERTLDKRLAYFDQRFYRPYKKLYQEYPQELEFQPFYVEMKKPQFAYAIDMMFRDILPKLKHGNDGLIFTCRTTAYKHGTDNHILKWKPPEENTVDCRLSLDFGGSGPEKYEYFNSQGRWRIVRFRDDKNEANHISTTKSVLQSIEDRVSEKDLYRAAGEIKNAWKARASRGPAR